MCAHLTDHFCLGGKTGVVRPPCPWRVTPEDRATFSKLIRKDHTESAAEDEFRDAWLNHCNSREDAGAEVAYGIRIGTAAAAAAQRHGANAGSAADRPMAALEAMLREQSPLPVRAGKSRMNPAPLFIH